MLCCEINHFVVERSDIDPLSCFTKMLRLLKLRANLVRAGRLFIPIIGSPLPCRSPQFDNHK